MSTAAQDTAQATPPPVEALSRWWRWVSFATSSVLLLTLGGWQVVVALFTAIAVVKALAWLWRRRRPIAPPGPVEVDGGGVTRTEGASTRLVWAELERIDGQERWPNLRLHQRSGPAIDLFPWSATEDDPAAVRVAELVLAHAASAGVDTTQSPVAMWRPSPHEIDWDRAIVAPSWWSRRRGDADEQASSPRSRKASSSG